MKPALSVLQLDTGFPRIPGDVAAPETYTAPVEILRVVGASVSNIVRNDPRGIEIGPFEVAQRRAKGRIVATSCGFLSYWQDHLQGCDTRPFVSSALLALPRLLCEFKPDELMIVTFDAESLGAAHVPKGAQDVPVVGLPGDSILRRAISDDQVFDALEAEAEVVDLVQTHAGPGTRHLVFECTNLPPFKKAIRAACGFETSSILSEIERHAPGLVHPDFL